jgi:tetratricopeptide (TPR) repeat protein
MRGAALLAVALLATRGDDAFDVGRAAYEAGEFDRALATFRAAIAAAGEDPPPELCFDQALCALRAGRLDEAEAAAYVAVLFGGDRYFELCDFLVGNVAFERCTLAERQAEAPLAEPMAWEVALAHADGARARWQAAAIARPDWPQARRNVERALRRIDELRRRKEAAAAENARARSAEPRIEETQAPPDSSTAPEERLTEERRPAPVEVELSAEELAHLPERLLERERAKLELRRSRRSRLQSEGDW